MSHPKPGDLSNESFLKSSKFALLLAALQVSMGKEESVLRSAFLIIEGGNAQVAEEFTRISCVCPVYFSASMW